MVMHNERPRRIRHILGDPPGFIRSGLLISFVFAAFAVSALWEGLSTGAPVPSSPHGDLKEECSLCHGSQSWVPAKISPKFDHAKYGFPLTGAHAQAPCSSCHTSLDFAKAATTCTDCHQDVHTGEMGEDCAGCHTSRSFIDRSQMEQMHQTSRFPLFGVHATLDCESCHTPGGQGNLSFVNQGAECVDCHMAQFQAATDPNHVDAGFSTDCARCHGSGTWHSVGFDHGATGFPLTGAHKSLACESCHAGGDYAAAQPQCISCHQDDYDNTTQPNHPASGYSLDCTTCHTTTGWEGAAFDHNATNFPLTGAHAALQCLSCHGDGVFSDKSTECASCHQADYDGTTDPNHAAAGYSLNCTTCHSTVSWDGATFDHNATNFPLTGAHTALACLSCHGDGVYSGKSTECASCHQSDYDNTTDPNHLAAGFPLDCAGCHNTSSWDGATFDHDSAYFHIYSGRHNGLWSSCADCHTNPQNYMDFTCFNCHPHDDQAKTDGDHRGMTGYAYDSQACYSCHHTGNGD
jgi:nitrate/TMAO reductase-like tetraheme cytochrome c subunit